VLQDLDDLGDAGLAALGRDVEGFSLLCLLSTESSVLGDNGILRVC
jgi:hypothetical protein